MDAAPPTKEYLDIVELSEITGRSVSSLRRDVRGGKLYAFQPGGPGGKLLFRRDALELSKVAVPAAATSPSATVPTHLPGRAPKWMNNSKSS